MVKQQRFLSKVISSIVPIDSLHWLFVTYCVTSQLFRFIHKGQYHLGPIHANSYILSFPPLSALQLCSFQPHASSAAESLRSSFAPSSLEKRSQPPAREKRCLEICLLSIRGCSFKKSGCAQQQRVLNPEKERSCLKTPPRLSATAMVTLSQNHTDLSHGASGRRGRLLIPSSSVLLKQKGQLARSGHGGN